MAKSEDPPPRGCHASARAAAPPPSWDPSGSCSSSCSLAGRSQSRLHNFSFPSVSWGSQRLLRCAKVDPHGVSSSADRVSTADSDLLKRHWSGISVPPRRRGGAEAESGGAGDRVGVGENERLRKCGDAVVAELQKAVNGIPLPRPLGPQREESKVDLGPSPPPAGEEASKPWNLRIRRAAVCSAPSAAPENGARMAMTQDLILVATEKGLAAAKYSGRIRRREAGAEEAERPRFSPVLSKDEIEEDFLLMTGSKPPRPKKRPRNLQKQIEVLCPGFYLTEITPVLYKTS